MAGSDSAWWALWDTVQKRANQLIFADIVRVQYDAVRTEAIDIAQRAVVALFGDPRPAFADAIAQHMVNDLFGDQIQHVAQISAYVKGSKLSPAFLTEFCRHALFAAYALEFVAAPDTYDDDKEALLEFARANDLWDGSQDPLFWDLDAAQIAADFKTAARHANERLDLYTDPINVHDARYDAGVVRSIEDNLQQVFPGAPRSLVQLIAQDLWNSVVDRIFVWPDRIPVPSYAKPVWVHGLVPLLQARTPRTQYLEWDTSEHARKNWLGLKMHLGGTNPAVRPNGIELRAARVLDALAELKRRNATVKKVEFSSVHDMQQFSDRLAADADDENRIEDNDVPAPAVLEIIYKHDSGFDGAEEHLQQIAGGAPPHPPPAVVPVPAPGPAPGPAPPAPAPAPAPVVNPFQKVLDNIDTLKTALGDRNQDLTDWETEATKFKVDAADFNAYVPTTRLDPKEKTKLTQSLTDYDRALDVLLNDIRTQQPDIVNLLADLTQLENDINNNRYVDVNAAAQAFALLQTTELRISQNQQKIEQDYTYSKNDHDTMQNDRTRLELDEADAVTNFVYDTVAWTFSVDGAVTPIDQKPLANANGKTITLTPLKISDDVRLFVLDDAYNALVDGLLPYLTNVTVTGKPDEAATKAEIKAEIDTRFVKIDQPSPTWNAVKAAIANYKISSEKFAKDTKVYMNKQIWNNQFIKPNAKPIYAGPKLGAETLPTVHESFVELSNKITAEWLPPNYDKSTIGNFDISDVKSDVNVETPVPWLAKMWLDALKKLRIQLQNKGAAAIAQHISLSDNTWSATSGQTRDDMLDRLDNFIRNSAQIDVMGATSYVLLNKNVRKKVLVKEKLNLVPLTKLAKEKKNDQTNAITTFNSVVRRFNNNTMWFQNNYINSLFGDTNLEETILQIEMPNDIRDSTEGVFNEWFIKTNIQTLKDAEKRFELSKKYWKRLPILRYRNIAFENFNADVQNKFLKGFVPKGGSSSSISAGIARFVSVFREGAPAAVQRRITRHVQDAIAESNRARRRQPTVATRVAPGSTVYRASGANVGAADNLLLALQVRFQNDSWAHVQKDEDDDTTVALYMSPYTDQWTNGREQAAHDLGNALERCLYYIRDLLSLYINTDMHQQMHESLVIHLLSRHSQSLMEAAAAAIRPA
jgi:hypothetical protein